MENSGNGIVAQINKLKKEKNAVILAHNYQSPEIQDIADYLGDSLDLGKKAAETDADVIVFCGVDFMAETASLLSPDKTVLLPEIDAKCPLAMMITREGLKKIKEEHPGVPVITYVNTTASVKAESGVCCTSANILKVADSFSGNELIVTPDKHLAAYLQSKTDKKIIPWQGYCSTHEKILPEHIKRQKELHPDALVVSHPECRMDVLEISDEVAGTGGMVRFAKESDAKEFIIATEVGMLHRLKKEAPDKTFYAASDLAVCHNMKKTSLHSVLNSLKNNKHVVSVPEDTRKEARKAIQRMLDLS